MQAICDHFYWFILLLAFAHMLGFAWLWRQRCRQAQWLAAHLENLVRGFSSHADRDPDASIDERVDSFLGNIREVLSDPARGDDQKKLYEKILAKDESKTYLRSSRFETLYSIARTSIEIYPLLGIMGTVLAIGLALNSPGADDAASLASERIVRNFAGSIWATLAGIGCGIVLLLVNAALEPAFQRLLEHRWDVRETISAAKTQLGTKPS
jgi:biopolymer transport protein ExbB/TolQ